ncbi:MAG: hypothetical protein RL660_2904 [Bacteroidota bacterium]|jgi:PKD repeat protein
MKKIIKHLVVLILLSNIVKAQTGCDASFTTSVDTANTPCVYDFVPNSSIGIISFGDGSWAWLNANGSTHTYSASGTYTVTHTVQDSISGCTDTSTQIINVTGCVLPCTTSIYVMPYQFNNCSREIVVSGNYNSDRIGTIYFGDGDSLVIAGATTVNHLYLNGNYTVWHVMRDTISGCVDSSSATLTASQCYPTILNAFPDSTGCTWYFVAQYAYSPTAGGVYYFGDGDSSIANLFNYPMHQYPNAGIYNAYFVFSDSSGVIDTAYHTVIATGCGSVTGCNAYIAAWQDSLLTCNWYFANTGGNSSNGYGMYYFGDGSSAAATNGITTHQYSSSGTYTAMFVYTDTTTNCSDTAWQTIAVSGFCGNSSCTASFTYTSNGGTYSFFGVGVDNINTFGYFSFGDGISYAANVGATNHNYYVNGPYNVCFYFIDSLNACIDSTCQTIVVNAIALCNAGLIATQDSISPCIFYFTGLINNATANSGIIYFGDGTSSNSISPSMSHQYNISGNYTAMFVYTDTLNNCIDTVWQTFFAGTCSTSLCNVQFTDSTDSLNPCTYYFYTSNINNTSTFGYYDFGDGTSSAGSNGVTSHTYNNNGIYQVSLYYVDSINGCIDSAFHYILVMGCSSSCGASLASFTDTIPCQWVFMPSVNGNTATSGTVYFGDGSSASANGNFLLHQYALDGTYLACFIYIDSNNGCVDTFCHTIVVTGCGAACNAAFTFTNDSLTPCIFDFNALGVNNISTAGYFSFGDGTSAAANIGNTSHTYAGSGIYNVCLVFVDSANNCIDTTCQQIIVTNCIAAKLESWRILDNVQVMPNPVNSALIVSTNSDAVTAIQVLDVTGKLMYASPTYKTKHYIDVERFATGTYYVKISDGRNCVTKLIVKH